MTKTASGFHLGHKDSAPENLPKAKFAEFIPGLKQAGLLPPLPDAPFGHGGSFRNWMMLGNGPSEGPHDVPESDTAATEGAGDCEVAGKYHEFMSDAHNTGHPKPNFTGKLALEVYGKLEEAEGEEPYNLVTGNSDNGLYTPTVLKYAQKKGFPDGKGGVIKIADYMEVEPKNPEHLFYAIWLLERAGIAIDFPESADEQFNQGVPWSVVKGAEIVGGHYIFGCGKPEKGSATATPYVAFITWARRTLMTLAFFMKYNTEVTTYVDLGQFRAGTGKDYGGHNMEELEKVLHTLAAQKAALL